MSPSIPSICPPPQDKECITVSVLNLLRLQLHSMIINNIDPKTIGLGTGSRLLSNLKSQIVNLASGNGILKTIQSAAQATLDVGWSVLLPTPHERAKALSSLLPSIGLEVTNGVSQGQRFMMDLLVSSLMADGGLESALASAIQSEITDPHDQSSNSRTSDSSIPLLHLIKQLLR